MTYLYLTKSSCKTGFRDGQIVVTDTIDKSVRSFPFAKVEGIAVFGMAQLTTQLIRKCIENDVLVQYYSDDGHYFGSLSSSNRIDPARQKKQIALTDNHEFCLTWAKGIIAAKIRNSMALLRSMSDYYVFEESQLAGLSHSLNALESAGNMSMLLGFEGNAAKNYFHCLSKVLADERFEFSGRSSRPPRDPFNSMLSFGYTLMYRNIIGSIERHGLHPYFAFMHQMRFGHAALASDLIEEYRAPIVDATVLGLINSGEIDHSGFYTSDIGAVHMDNATMKKVVDALSDAMVKRRRYFLSDGDNRSYSFQTVLDVKLSSLVTAIETGDAKLYRPFIWQGTNNEAEL